MVETQSRSSTVSIVDCSGPPRKRGEAHGEALRGLIADGFGRWSESIAAAQGVDPDAYIARFVEQTDFLPAIRRWTPELLEEIDGIARGAGQPWQRIYAANLMDEEGPWAKSYRETEAPGCTVAGFAVPGEFPTLAQTMDISNFHDGTQAVLRIALDDERSLLMFTFAGLIGLTGCNSDGVAVGVNSLDTLPGVRSGLPVAFVIRGLLERKTLADAVAFVSDVPHASGQHYGMAGPFGLASVEAWATGAAVESEPGTRLLHTNHPLLSQEETGDVEATYRRSATRERLDYLEREAGPRRDAAGMQVLLTDRSVPVSRGVDRTFMTFGAVVYECQAPARMWLAPGPPHETPFVRIPWQWQADAAA